MRRLREKIETLMILLTIGLAIIIVISFLVFLSDIDQNLSVLPLIFILTFLFYSLNFINNSSERNKYTAYRKTNPKDNHILFHSILIIVSLVFSLLSVWLLWV